MVPFNTNAGFGAGNSLRVINKLCRGCQVAEALIIEAVMSEKVRCWPSKAGEQRRFKLRRMHG